MPRRLLNPSLSRRESPSLLPMEIKPLLPKLPHQRLPQREVQESQAKVAKRRQERRAQERDQPRSEYPVTPTRAMIDNFIIFLFKILISKPSSFQNNLIPINDQRIFYVTKIFSHR